MITTQTMIEKCDFSVRTENLLFGIGVRTAEEALALPEQFLLKQRGFGRKQVAEITDLRERLIPGARVAEEIISLFAQLEPGMRAEVIRRLTEPT